MDLDEKLVLESLCINVSIKGKVRDKLDRLDGWIDNQAN